MKYTLSFCLLFLATACTSTPTTQEEQQSTPVLSSFTGTVMYEQNMIGEVDVAALDPETQLIMAHTVTSEDGTFDLALPDDMEAYDIIVGKVTERGIYTMTKGTPLTFKRPNSGSSDLGIYNLEFIELDPEDMPDTDMSSDYSTMQAPLGVGHECLAVGCSPGCWHGIRYIMCGYSICFWGIQLPIPYWYWPC